MKKHESFQGHLWYTLSDEFVCKVISLSLFKFCPACDTFTASPRRLGELKCDKHFLADLGHSRAGLCVQMCAGSAESFSYWLRVHMVHMVAHDCTWLHCFSADLNKDDWNHLESPNLSTLHKHFAKQKDGFVSYRNNSNICEIALMACHHQGGRSEGGDRRSE